MVETGDAVDALAETVFVPENDTSAALVIAIVTSGGRGALDVGRVAQNMMLTARNEGVLSTLNGFPDGERAAGALGLADDEQPSIVITFGYPPTARDPAARTAAEWSRRANRKALDEIVERR